MAEVFVAYAQEDEAFVRRMGPALAGEGFRVAWDHIIRPGDTWDDYMTREVAKAQCCVILWSENSVESAWVKSTISIDRSRLFPVKIDASQPPLGFRRTDAAELGGWNGNTEDPQWQVLVREVGGLVTAAASRPNAAPAAPPPRPAPPPRAAAATTAPGRPAPPMGAPSGGSGRASPLLIGAMAISVAAAVVALVFALSPNLMSSAPPAQTAQTQQLTAEDGPTESSPSSTQAELERLRRERDEALAEEQRVAAERAKLAQQATVAQQPATPASLNGRWTYCNSRGFCDAWVFTNGAYTTGGGHRGAFTLDGARFEARSTTSGTFFVGTLQGGVIRGQNSSNVTFELTRQ